jgi:hypothetical protein
MTTASNVALYDTSMTTRALTNVKKDSEDQVPDCWDDDIDITDNDDSNNDIDSINSIGEKDTTVNVIVNDPSPIHNKVTNALHSDATVPSIYSVPRTIFFIELQSQR